ncbi:MAG: glycosyltransferase family 2 protein [Vicinamibacterales bacterium]
MQIVTWNSAPVIGACLMALARQTERRFEVVIVDNASTDQTVAIVQRHAQQVPGLTCVALGLNTGFCAGQNRATQMSTAPWVLFLNPDTELPPDFIACAVATSSASGPRVGAVAPCIVRPDGSIDSTGLTMDRFRRAYDRDRGCPIVNKDRAPRQVFGCTGAVALLRRSMLDDVAVDHQVLDERIFAYYDDLDLAWRAKLRGWTCAYEPGLTALHHRAARNAILQLAGRTTSRRDRALSVRNRLLVMLRCDSRRAVLLALPWLLPFEFARILYLLLTAPRVLGAYADLAREIGPAMRARRTIHGRATHATPTSLECAP